MTLESFYILSIVRIAVLWCLLSVNEGDTVDVLILMVVLVVVSSSDQLLFRSLQSHWSYRLGTIVGYIDVSKILWIVVMIIVQPLLRSNLGKWR